MKEKKNNPKIFISHAGKDEAISEKLKSQLQENGFEVIMNDKLLSYKGSIYDLMNESIDNAKYIIILISESYLTSKHCMFEFTEISRNLNFSNKCFPLIIKNTDIFSNKKKYVVYWDSIINNIEKELKYEDENSNENNRLLYDLNICTNNKYKVDNLFNYLNHMYTFEIGEHLDEVIKGFTNAIETKSKIDNQKALEDDTTK